MDKTEDEAMYESLADMILEGKKEEMELAAALKKILEWVDEGGEKDKWVYEIYEPMFDEGENQIYNRKTFLDGRGKEGWILCTEIAFHDEFYGKLTRYTFRRRES